MIGPKIAYAYDPHPIAAVIDRGGLIVENGNSLFMQTGDDFTIINRIGWRMPRMADPVVVIPKAREFSTAGLEVGKEIGQRPRVVRIPLHEIAGQYNQVGLEMVDLLDALLQKRDAEVGRTKMDVAYLDDSEFLENFWKRSEER